ncbi:LIM domain protein [Wolffia australiana]
MDPSQTKRIVILLDLHPIVAGQDRLHYTTAVLSAARRILSFNPLSDSLFACKPFFSSLSPLLSTSLVHRLVGKSGAFLSFDRPHQILEQISFILSSASSNDLAGCFGLRRASLMSESLFQLAYDCIWEPPREISREKTDVFLFRSNMVVLFSPVIQSKENLPQFLDFNVQDGKILDVGRVRAEFVAVFGPVNELFISKDVHFAWIQVDCGTQQSVDLQCKRYLEGGIREIGWSSCSADAVALGAVFIPFGLIYAYIGSKIPSHSGNPPGRGRANLKLEISDASGKPLQCKCCDLDLSFLSIKTGISGELDLFSQDSTGIAEILVNDVIDQSISQSQISAVLLLREFPVDLIEPKQDEPDPFLPDKILELFSGIASEASFRGPIWQLLLAFLHRRGSSALVSINRDKGQSFLGFISPISVNSAVMYVVDSLNIESPETPSSEHAMNKHRQKKRRRIEGLLQELPFNKFRELVYNGKTDPNLEVAVEDLYFSLGRSQSKKLRFLQCWMKQYKKRQQPFSGVSDRNIFSEPKEEMKERLVGSENQTDVPASSPSSVDLKEEYPSDISLQTAESFSESIAQKIKRILGSKEGDLRILAERVVKLAVYYFSAKLGDYEKENSCKASAVADEVIKLLLEKPKDTIAKYKSPNPSQAPSDPSVSDVQIKVRAHELQILFRMEILKLPVGSSTDNHTKRKFVKDICSLLANIEFDLQGSMFSGESLIEFAGRTIQSRYRESLEPIVQKIYAQMEFLPFDEGEEEEEDEIPSQPTSSSGGHRRDVDDDAAPGNANQTVLMAALERRERARRFSHFNGWSRNLERIWAPKQDRKPKPKPRPTQGPLSLEPNKASKRRFRPKDAVRETPMGRERARSPPSGGPRARLSKALFGPSSP